MTPVAYNGTLTIVSRDDNLVPKWWWLRFNIRRLFCWGASPWQSRRHADNCVSSQNPLQLVSSQETGVTLKPCFRGSISAGWTRGNNTWFSFYCFLKVSLCIFFFTKGSFLKIRPSRMKLELMAWELEGLEWRAYPYSEACCAWVSVPWMRNTGYRLPRQPGPVLP